MTQPLCPRQTAERAGRAPRDHDGMANDISVRRLDLGYFVRPASETGGPEPRVEPVLAYLVRHERGLLLPDVLAAQRKERARIRSEKGIRWGGRPLNAAA